MNKKLLALSVIPFLMLSCDAISKNPEQKGTQTFKISNTSKDDDKFAYMLGAQFGGQNFTIIPTQVGERLDEDALVQGIFDSFKTSKDENAKIQLIVDSLQAIGGRYSVIARDRMQSLRPDSAKLAEFAGDMQKINAYSDSVSKTLPIKPAPAVTGKEVKIAENSSDIQKFSYMLGTNMGAQFANISAQFESDFDVNAFVAGIRESATKVGDTSFVMSLPDDSLKAVGERYDAKRRAIQEAAQKKFEEEQAKLKEEVAGLRGETLSNGMPKLMNFGVKLSKINSKFDSFDAVKGQPLFLFYFSATCGHCAHAAPVVYEIAKEFSAKGLTSIAISSGGNNKSGIRKFADNSKWEEAIHVMWDENRQFGELYSDGYVPKFYVVNPDGTYKQYTSIEQQIDEIKSDIQGLLEGKKVEWVLEAPAEPAPAPAQ